MADSLGGKLQGRQVHSQGAECLKLTFQRWNTSKDCRYKRLPDEQIHSKLASQLTLPGVCILNPRSTEEPVFFWGITLSPLHLVTYLTLPEFVFCRKGGGRLGRRVKRGAVWGKVLGSHPKMEESLPRPCPVFQREACLLRGFPKGMLLWSPLELGDRETKP